ncbi:MULTISPECIES: hypothetical protein [unclassified Pseudonocardia]|uniref:hypothetical protein n=1 Tax=unclassified Pseudonocardia TaxID=2619320 RepID=UPI00095F28A9|nr:MULTISPECIES: hypothetical protein [unclassified Pseudonocardia]OJY43599.1 MAG: hypothetical protein BGP03_25910 [Pseudonocardia sp. 73-21]
MEIRSDDVDVVGPVRAARGRADLRDGAERRYPSHLDTVLWEVRVAQQRPLPPPPVERRWDRGY